MIAPETGMWLIDADGYGYSNKSIFGKVNGKTLAERNLPRDPSAFLANGVFRGPALDADRMHKA